MRLGWGSTGLVGTQPSPDNGQSKHQGTNEPQKLSRNFLVKITVNYSYL